MTEAQFEDRPRIIELDETPSTSSEAMRLAQAGDLGPLWVLAHHQTRGRGRSGRSWQTARGNLAFSHLFAPEAEAAALPQLSLVAGVAACAGLAEVWPEGAAARRLRLKWPNDLMIERAKIGGLLVEATLVGTTQVCVVGIGVNLAHAPEIEGREVDCLARHMDRAPVVRGVAEAIARQFAAWRAVWDRGRGFETVRAAWLDRAGPAGEPIVVNAGDGPVAGTFLGLDTDGALLLGGDDGSCRRFTFGDVTLAPR